MRYLLSIALFLGIIHTALGNNVRILGNVIFDGDEIIQNNNVMSLSCTVTWENSWRDDYNWDAAYVFFKYRVKDADDGTKSPDTRWHHVYLRDLGHIVEGMEWLLATNYTDSVTSVTKDAHPGIFIYRNGNGQGDVKASLKVLWDVTSNTRLPLTSTYFAKNQVEIVAMAIETIYVPTGAFYMGDGVSNRSFKRKYMPIPEKYDLMNDTLPLIASPSMKSDPKLLVDHLNDNSYDPAKPNPSCWAPERAADNFYWVRVDFGKPTTIRYFGVNPSKDDPNNIPEFWEIYGSNDTKLGTSLWKGGSEDWIKANDAYPAEHAIVIPTPQPYRYYRLYIKMPPSKMPRINTWAMTDQDINTLLSQSVIIDHPQTVIDSLRGLGAVDGDNWGGGTIDSPVKTPVTYPNGFQGFYAMKYELTQEQYVKFINRLTKGQQESLLGNLSALTEGAYIFGSTHTKADTRNGIILTKKSVNGVPYEFGNNLDASNPEVDDKADGQTVACNFMSITDMLAYADWTGLRPLTEFEYEKIARRPYPEVPAKGEIDGAILGEFAWNTINIEKTTGVVEHPGETNEVPSNGNANFENGVRGPIRVGAYAAIGNTQITAGSGFYGGMDLSGNLAEIYYNGNEKGRVFNAYAKNSHGDGYLKQDAQTDIPVSIWPQDAQVAFILKGGSFQDSRSVLSVGDRSFNKHFTDLKVREPFVTFRLGYSIPSEKLETFLTLQNNQSTYGGAQAIDTICGYTTTYTIYGNKPKNIRGVCTYMWYIKEEGGVWRLLEDEYDQNLTYRRFVNNTAQLKQYKFKRLLTTPTAYGETGEVTIVVDQSANAKINILRDTVNGYGRSTGGFYASSDLPSEFVWKWVNEGRVITLQQDLGSSTYSHYVPSKEDFKNSKGRISYGTNKIQMERTTIGMKECVTAINVEVFIEEEKRPAYPSREVACGEYMIDERDGQIYPTTLIGTSMCWMAENLNWSGTGRCYKGQTANCARYGRMYTWWEANDKVLVNSFNKKGICPEGWHLPSDEDWNKLISFLGTISNANPGWLLKASKYWTYHSNDEIGVNSVGFNAIPGGYYRGGYDGLNTYVGWWSTNYSSYTYRAVYYCSGHGYNYTHGSFRYYEYYYDGYHVHINYNNNLITGPTLFRVNSNAYNSDNLYVRCVKD